MKRKFRSRSWCIVLIAVTLSATAQNTTFKAQSNLVSVPVLVENSTGQIVYGLRQNDFEILDDGVPQQVRLDEAVTDQPVSVVVTIQRGRSAPYEYPRIRGLKAFVDSIIQQPNAETAVVAFDDHPRLLNGFTSSLDVVNKNLESILNTQAGVWYPQPGEGGAATLDAVGFSIKLLEHTLRIANVCSCY